MDRCAPSAPPPFKAGLVTPLWGVLSIGTVKVVEPPLARVVPLPGRTTASD